MFRGVHLKSLFKKKQIYGHKAEVFPSFYKLILLKLFLRKRRRQQERRKRGSGGLRGERDQEHPAQKTRS